MEKPAVTKVTAGFPSSEWFFVGQIFAACGWTSWLFS
jgi:hypothetical protein